MWPEFAFILNYFNLEDMKTPQFSMDMLSLDMFTSDLHIVVVSIKSYIMRKLLYQSLKMKSEIFSMCTALNFIALGCEVALELHSCVPPQSDHVTWALEVGLRLTKTKAAWVT